MARNSKAKDTETPEEGAAEVRVTGLIQRALEIKCTYSVMETFPEDDPPPPEPEEANALFKFKVMGKPLEKTPPSAPTLSDMNK